MKIKCKICDKYIDSKPCPYPHTKLELKRASKRTSLNRFIVINSNMSNKYTQNNERILKLTFEIEQISDQIKIDAVEKNKRGAV